MDGKGEWRDNVFIDEVVPADELLSAAKAWIESVQGDEEAAVQPWDRKGYRIPGGTPSSPSLAAVLPSFPANLVKQVKGADFKAPKAIMAAAVEGAQVDFDTASRIESRYLTELIIGQQFKNMTQAFFFDLSAINAGNSRPEGIERKKFQKVGVIGAGMMGAGIAYVSAKAGMEVVLKDVSLEAAEKGKSYSATSWPSSSRRAGPRRRRSTSSSAASRRPTDYDDLEGVDLVVEAVFENQELKHSVFAELEPKVLPDALLGSNTSTLPITGLAEGVEPAGRLHRHPLLLARSTRCRWSRSSPARRRTTTTIAHALDYVQQIKKTPIVVNDSRGFFTCGSSDVHQRGPADAGRGRQPGGHRSRGHARGLPDGRAADQRRAEPQVDEEDRRQLQGGRRSRGRHLCAGAGRARRREDARAGPPGKLEGKGFYDYADGKRVGLWDGLAEVFPVADEQPPLKDLEDRLIFSMSIDTVNCLAEGVLRTVPDANIGSIFGIGFPASARRRDPGRQRLGRCGRRDRTVGLRQTRRGTGFPVRRALQPAGTSPGEGQERREVRLI